MPHPQPDFPVSPDDLKYWRAWERWHTSFTLTSECQPTGDIENRPSPASVAAGELLWRYMARPYASDPFDTDPEQPEPPGCYWLYLVLAYALIPTCVALMLVQPGGLRGKRLRKWLLRPDEWRLLLRNRLANDDETDFYLCESVGEIPADLLEDWSANGEVPDSYPPDPMPPNHEEILNPRRIGTLSLPSIDEIPILLEDEDAQFLPEQERAVDHLLGDTDEVLDRLRNLLPEEWNLHEVVVSRLHLCGVAYLCLRFAVRGREYFVVYHPMLKPTVSDGDGLKEIQVADNLF